jgi:hypothetical protein
VKKVISAVAMLIMAVIFSGCFGTSDIDLVKNGVMNRHKSLTVGDAMDNWKACDKKEWEEYETDNGERIVRFVCYNTDMSQFADLKEWAKDKEQIEEAIDYKSIVSEFQWTINLDNTFELTFSENTITWNNGKSVKLGHTDSLIDTAYNNEYVFDMEKMKNAPELKMLLNLTGSDFYQMVAPTFLPTYMMAR